MTCLASANSLVSESKLSLFLCLDLAAEMRFFMRRSSLLSSMAGGRGGAEAGGVGENEGPEGVGVVTICMQWMEGVGVMLGELVGVREF